MEIVNLLEMNIFTRMSIKDLNNLFRLTLKPIRYLKNGKAIGLGPRYN